MVTQFRMSKVKEYAQPHDNTMQLLLGADNASVRNCTHLPSVFHDEAMLASAKNTHPEHASFIETDALNCSAESKIFKIQCTMRLSLTKAFLVTDNGSSLRIAFMSIHGAFEDFDATDELTSVSIANTLELTKESTDRQTYPLYDDTKLVEKYAASATFDAAQPGMTASQVIENVAFDAELYYDNLNYYTTKGKLKKVQDGLRWITLTRDNPTRLIRFTMKGNAKTMNPYTYLGQMVYLPITDSKYQIPIAADITNTYHVAVDYRCRFLEWNHNFQHQRA